MSNNSNVIIASSWKSDSRKYHTTRCRQVSNINSKRYVSRETAEQMGWDECAYCSGEFEANSSENTLYKAAVAYGQDDD
jgi:hypothetical protein